ncbi:hypothetical protein C2G38_2250016 [Gigaspora rosea]|uniref:BED-type domain-containing protein n=1 Tax=Gigaspora rosea TaxID=44941 RepID=A0A397UQQ6_9GLOM|nr:hypothetical protein C2G38_2250016 [Gigaspora rosea]
MENTQDLSSENNSEAETAPSISTALSASSANSLIRKKRKEIHSTPVKTSVKPRSNRSHTTYFFRPDSNDPFVAYCKTCEANLANTRQKLYPYSRKGGNTSNLINHLRDKHGITKDNYLGFLDEHNEPRRDQVEHSKVVTPCTPKQQELITQSLISFIIKFVQPLYILQNESFRELLLTCHGYLGVTATWLTSNFEFCEALLSCNHLPYPHSGEVISAELLQVINDWNLSNVTFAITTDSGGKHVLQGLKQCKQVHCRVKCDYDNYNPLDVKTDVKTRWNLVYYAWKRIMELHNSMLHVSTTLLTKPDRISQQEGEKLNRLCLSHDEKQFFQDAIKLLSPFEKITRRICRATYCTLSLVHPYIELLKKAFAPKCENGESYDTYLNLIYGQQCEDGDEEESDSSTSDNNEIPSGGSRRHWQYAHRQFQQKMRITKGKGRGKDEFNQIESLPATNTVGLLQRMNYSTPSDIVRIATILDPRFKDFKWDDTFEEREKSLELLQKLYDSMKEDSQPGDINQPTFYDCSDDDDDFFKALENKVGSGLSAVEEDEVLHYIRLRQIDVDQDSLK